LVLSGGGVPNGVCCRISFFSKFEKTTSSGLADSDACVRSKKEETANSIVHKRITGENSREHVILLQYRTDLVQHTGRHTRRSAFAISLACGTINLLPQTGYCQ